MWAKPYSAHLLDKTVYLICYLYTVFQLYYVSHISPWLSDFCFLFCLFNWHIFQRRTVGNCRSRIFTGQIPFPVTQPTVSKQWNHWQFLFFTVSCQLLCVLGAETKCRYWNCTDYNNNNNNAYFKRPLTINCHKDTCSDKTNITLDKQHQFQHLLCHADCSLWSTPQFVTGGPRSMAGRAFRDHGEG